MALNPHRRREDHVFVVGVFFALRKVLMNRGIYTSFFPKFSYFSVEFKPLPEDSILATFASAEFQVLV